MKSWIYQALKTLWKKIKYIFDKFTRLLSLHVTKLKKKMFLLVFDINGVFCKAGMKGTCSVRPYVQELFKVLHKHRNIYRVAFWTSKYEENGRKLMDRILHEIPAEFHVEPLFFWFRQHCKISSAVDKSYASIKQLRNVWNDFPEYHSGNTLLIDDTPSKAESKENYLYVPPYRGPRCDPQDIVLLQLANHIHQCVIDEGDMDIKDHMLEFESC